MAQVFVSYSRHDEARVRFWMLWRGQASASRMPKTFPQACRSQTRLAKRSPRAGCVVIVWSKAASRSEWVQREVHLAIEAWSAGKLVLVSLDDAPLPVVSGTLRRSHPRRRRDGSARGRSPRRSDGPRRAAGGVLRSTCVHVRGACCGATRSRGGVPRVRGRGNRLTRGRRRRHLAWCCRARCGAEPAACGHRHRPRGHPYRRRTCLRPMALVTAPRRAARCLHCSGEPAVRRSVVARRHAGLRVL
ncbi:MAG: toll/interleukin-1 receptor domain-containing protein [Methyloceanibacter sp.]